jgi:hypothetical protein
LLCCTLLGIGAMASPLYLPAGLLVSAGRWRVMLDGGPGAEPDPILDAWLVSDADSELLTPIRRLGAAHGLEPTVAAFDRPDVSIQPRAVVHTSHPTFGYLIEARGRRVVWAPEFVAFPDWAAGADLMFAAYSQCAAWARWPDSRCRSHAFWLVASQFMDGQWSVAFRTHSAQRT